MFESRHCAFCDGKVTLVFVGPVVAAFVWLELCTASLRRFMRAVLEPSCDAVPSPDIETFEEREVYPGSQSLFSIERSVPLTFGFA